MPDAFNVGRFDAIGNCSRRSRGRVRGKPCDRRRALSMAHPLVSWATRHRQRIARLLLVVAVCFGATQVWPAVPQTTDIRIDLGPQHLEIMELSVGVTRDGEPLHAASFRFPEGAPATVRHELVLPTGRYEVELRCRGSAGTTSVERVIEVPGSGVVHIDASGGRV